jgi:hypothetical protein
MTRSKNAVCGAMACAVAIGTLLAVAAHADTPPPESSHQRMKDCMAAQKTVDTGKTYLQKRKECRDVVNTDKHNDATEKKAESAPPPPTP